MKKWDFVPPARLRAVCSSPPSMFFYVFGVICLRDRGSDEATNAGYEADVPGCDGCYDDAGEVEFEEFACGHGVSCFNPPSP